MAVLKKRPGRKRAKVPYVPKPQRGTVPLDTEHLPMHRVPGSAYGWLYECCGEQWSFRKLPGHVWAKHGLDIHAMRRLVKASQHARKDMRVYLRKDPNCPQCLQPWIGHPRCRECTIPLHDADDLTRGPCRACATRFESPWAGRSIEHSYTYVPALLWDGPWS